ncbi:hypothetical protein, partial [Streptomyces sp. NRRL F-2664]|uniref:hypothetical protein n=1 Tax=Streptomyces sp. NRRL F-2664 TaxID=1463842 RepID=UPI00131CBAA7
TGRFTTRDPHPTPLNKYQAFAANPIENTDPTGNITLRFSRRRHDPDKITPTHIPGSGRRQSLHSEAAPKVEEAEPKHPTDMPLLRASETTPGASITSGATAGVDVAKNLEDSGSGAHRPKGFFELFGVDPTYLGLLERSATNAYYATSAHLSGESGALVDLRKIVQVADKFVDSAEYRLYLSNHVKSFRKKTHALSERRFEEPNDLTDTDRAWIDILQRTARLGVFSSMERSAIGIHYSDGPREFRLKNVRQ